MLPVALLYAAGVLCQEYAHPAPLVLFAAAFLTASPGAGLGARSPLAAGFAADLDGLDRRLLALGHFLLPTICVRSLDGPRWKRVCAAVFWRLSRSGFSSGRPGTVALFNTDSGRRDFSWWRLAARFRKSHRHRAGRSVAGVF